MVNYVRAPSQSNGCIVACLGMITGQTYKEVLSNMEQYWKSEGSEQGVDDEAWTAYLAARGYAVQDVPHDYVPTDKLIEPWPLKPFAPIHMVFVYDEGPHAVIMTDDGTIMDPNDDKISKIDQYYRVYRIVGIWKVRDKLEFIK